MTRRLLAAVACAAALSLLGLPALDLGRGANAQGYGDALVTGVELARRKACQSNVKQIGVFLIMYANDHDDAFPKTLGELLKGGYLTSAKTLHCPGDAKPYKEPEQKDFRNMEVADIDKAIDPILSYALAEGVDHRDDAGTIVLYEKDGAHKGVGRHVLFNDGSVKWLPEAEFQKRIAEQRQRSGAGKREAKP
jgi:hypothetical protein